MLVDSHCHLDFAGLHKRLDEVVLNAKKNDVMHMNSICTRLGVMPKILKIARDYPNITCTVGLHPLHVKDDGVPTADEIAKLTDDPKVVGVGETGLDYHYDTGEELIALQKQSFVEHIKASQKVNLPLILHSRKAGDDILSFFAKHAIDGKINGVMHSYTGNLKDAEKFLEMGLYISASGIVTFTNAPEVQEVFANIPLNRILIETDSPFLTPVPHRGKQNEPAYVKHVAEFLAKLRGISYEEVAKVTTENFFTLFSKAKNSSNTKSK